jgi:hypothetical protein
VVAVLHLWVIKPDDCWPVSQFCVEVAALGRITLKVLLYSTVQLKQQLSV